MQLRIFKIDISILLISLFLLTTLLFSDDSNNRNENKVTIVFTGSNNGFFRDCGWPFKTLGGLAERKTYFDKLRNENINENILFLDSGDMLEVFPSKGENVIVSTVYPMLGYDAIAIGDQEFIEGIDFFKKYLLNKLPFVSSNFRFNPELNINYKTKIKPYRTFQLKNGIKIGVTSLNFNSGFKYLVQNKTIKDGDIYVEKAFKSLRGNIKSLREVEKVDYVILLSHLKIDGINKLVDKVKGYDLLIGGHNLDEFELAREINDIVWVQNGTDGEIAGRVELYFDKKNRSLKSYKYYLDEIDVEIYDRDKTIDNVIKEFED